MNRATWTPVFASGLTLVIVTAAVAGEKKYDPGVTDDQIKIGQTMPYSGAVSALGAVGKASAAYFAMINDQGGVNGRKIKLISLDDGYSPSKTVEQTRKLVEQDQVLLLFNSLGTPTNSAVQEYLNDLHVPQLFVQSGAAKWGDPQHFPWTMGGTQTLHTEARILVKYLFQVRPDAKIAVLYQNDDSGKDFVEGIKDGLGDSAKRMIIGEATYETTDATVDSQIAALRATGADTFFSFAISKFAAQAIRKAYDIGWRPLFFVNSLNSSVGATLKPAGLEKSVGLISGRFYKDPTDPQWKNDAAYQAWLAWMKKYQPHGDVADGSNVAGYYTAQMLVEVLRRCGDELTRENVMRQATNLDIELPMLLPGIRVKTSPIDYYPIKQLQLARFDGTTWRLFGDILSDAPNSSQ